MDFSYGWHFTTDCGAFAIAEENDKWLQYLSQLFTSVGASDAKC